MKIFYDHLTVFEEITIELDKYKFDRQEREEIVRLVDENMHHRVLDVILTHLPKERHQDFLTKFHSAPHDSNLLTYLKKEVENIEDLIISEAKKVKAEILREFRRAQKTSVL